MVQVPEEFSGKAEWVHHIFTNIAGRYDRMNSIFSFGQDGWWREELVLLSGFGPGDYVVDVCCGTGKVTTILAREVAPTGRVVGVDFCEQMLDGARRNIGADPWDELIEFVQGDATALPFSDSSFDGACTAFGLRNVSDYRKVLAELRRVVRPGGTVAVMELAKPFAPIWRDAYFLYFNHVMPWIGRLGVGRKNLYEYLPGSLREFPDQDTVFREIQEIGFTQVKQRVLDGGIVAIHTAVKPLAASPSGAAISTRGMVPAH